MVRSFPKMKGICTLFQATEKPYPYIDEESSPFEHACDVAYVYRSEYQSQWGKDLESRWGRGKVMDAIKRVLERNSDLISNVNDQTQNCNDAVVLAMLDDSITLDGLFFLLRRSPDILGNMLLQQNNELSSSIASSSIRPKKKRRRPKKKRRR